ncbi:hypothetical protein D3C73_1336330 [compost metagenome]
MLPELAGKIAAPISTIDKLTVVDTGKGEGAARVSNYVTELMATAPEMLKSVSGIELDKLIKGLTQGKGNAQQPLTKLVKDAAPLTARQDEAQTAQKPPVE